MIPKDTGDRIRLTLCAIILVDALYNVITGLVKP